MNGLPGPYVKWFMKELGHEGLNKMLAGYEDKSAQAVCTFGYCAGPGEEAILFEGRTDGKIVPARGPAVFGWDAIFEHEGQTYVGSQDRDMGEGKLTGAGTRRWIRWRRTRCRIDTRRWISCGHGCLRIRSTRRYSRGRVIIIATIYRCCVLNSLRMVVLPAFYPRGDTLDVGLHVVGGVAAELNHDLLIVPIPRLLQHHLHDLRVEVFLQLILGVIPTLLSAPPLLHPETCELTGP